MKLALIVEGEGDVAAFPILLRRVTHALGHHDVQILVPPVRVSRSKLAKQTELCRYVELLARKLGPASAASLAGKRGLPDDLQPPEQDPEQLRDAKGWLARQMPRRYHETVDQPALIRLARRRVRGSTDPRRLCDAQRARTRSCVAASPPRSLCDRVNHPHRLSQRSPRTLIYSH